ncbi:MAG: DUF3772 domain-containing protein [Pseudomonadota bacterium]
MKKLLLLVILLFWSPLIQAQEIDPEILDGVETRRSVLEEAADQIEAGGDIDFLQLREELRAVRSEAQNASRPLRSRRDEIQADIDRLGPAPEDGQSETEDIASTRAMLVSQFQTFDEAIRQADLNIGRANRLLDDIANARRSVFFEDVFSPGPSPLSPSLWTSARDSFLAGAAKVQTDILPEIVENDTAPIQQGKLLILALATLFALVLFIPVRRYIETRIVSAFQKGEPAQSKKTAIAGARMLGRFLPGLVGGFVVFETARAEGFITEFTQPIAFSVWCGIVALLVVDGIATGVFAPKSKTWRLIPIGSGAAFSLRVLLLSATALFALDAALNTGAGILSASSELTQLQGAVVAIIGASLLLLICRQRLWKLEEGHSDFAVDTRANWHALRRIGIGVAWLAIIAAILGYSALARYVISRIFFLAAIFSLGMFVRGMAQEFIAIFRRRAVRRAKADEFVEESDERIVFFWVGVIIDVVLLALASPLIMLLLGFEWVEVRDWLSDAFFGFQIGNVRISISQILTAIVTFILILFATRFIQRAADTRVFSRARMDEGIRNSFRTLIGYAGMVIAVLSAVTMLGLNLASLAFVAGALSLGIGFGLQSIVNNFVSGLILLFERPIKVGDWVVVASGEGIVKRISVRSTEIETFDRSSMIVPNSELISSSVTNWTHKDKFTRIIVHVGVSYNEDPRAVIALLEKVIDDNPRVMNFPKPSVYFAGFGDSSLDFELRVFIRDTADRIPVQNELRIATFEAFVEAGIEIPFPQRDLHLKTMPDALTVGQPEAAKIEADNDASQETPDHSESETS